MMLSVQQSMHVGPGWPPREALSNRRDSVEGDPRRAQARAQVVEVGVA
jgi:hypothetical protein